jgi:hypothetical protein
MDEVLAAMLGTASSDFEAGVEFEGAACAAAESTVSKRSAARTLELILRVDMRNALR